MDCSQRDCFELIGAFLDGETSPEESQRVRQLLAEDPQARKLYQRLQALRQGLRHLPEPEPSIDAESLAERVFAANDRRLYRRAIWWGGGAIAALFVAMLSVGGDLLPGYKSAPQIAEGPDGDALLVFVNEPLVTLPDTTPANRAPERAY